MQAASPTRQPPPGKSGSSFPRRGAAGFRSLGEEGGASGSFSPALSPFSRECVALFVEVVQVLGVPKSVGQIYGVLYASPEPLSFSDIVERLEISKGSVSQGLQLLRSLGAVNTADAKPCAASGKRKAGPTDARPYAMPLTLNPGVSESPRRDYYEPELRLRRLVSGALRERVMPLATARVDRLTRLRALAEQVGQGRPFLLDRVRKLETWRRRLKTVLPVLSALLGPSYEKR